MRFAPICPACGSLVQERRTFTDDGPVVVATICDCGHIESFTLSFEASRNRASLGSHRPPVADFSDVSSTRLSSASSAAPGAFCSEVA